MQTLSQLLDTEDIPLQEEEQRHTRRLMVGILCALVLTGSVFGGYLFLRKRHERQVAAAAQEATKKAGPKVEVAVDDAMIDGKKSVLGGELHNISGETLHNIAVELQLRKRSGSSVETRIVVAESSELPPDGRTRYRLEVAVQDYSSATFS